MDFLAIAQGLQYILIGLGGLFGAIKIGDALGQWLNARAAYKKSLAESDVYERDAALKRLNSSFEILKSQYQTEVEELTEKVNKLETLLEGRDNECQKQIDKLKNEYHLKVKSLEDRIKALEEQLKKSHEKVKIYEGFLRAHGINPDTGQREYGGLFGD